MTLGPPERRSWRPLGLTAALALLVALIALRPPHPQPAQAPADQFSAARAMADVRVLGQAPHPVGSAGQAKVRAYLLGRMAALGLDPQARPVSAPQGPAANLLGVLPGKDRAAPAVLIMAHQDSVPMGPGAADDGAGVAAALETVRAIETRGVPARDVMLLLTDGEEAGSLGAKAFFTSNPMRGHAGLVVNLEARGDRGRAVMFETQPQAGAMIGRLAHDHALSGASSLMPDLYRRLPNGTDLTWAIRNGYRGLNFAIFSGLDAYHTALDTPQRLDPASLQSLGDQVLKAVRAFLTPAPLPSAAPDGVYADILGGPELAYPAAGGWWVLAAAGALLLLAGQSAVRAGQASLTGLALGALAAAGLMLLLGAGLWLEGAARVWADGRRLAPLLRHDSLTLAVLLAGCAGLGLVWLRLTRWLAHSSLWLGSLSALLILAMVVQLRAPLDAFVFAWPLLIGALSATLAARGGVRLMAILALFGAAQALYWTGLMSALVGQTTPVALAPFAAVTLLALLPLAPNIGPTSKRASRA